MAFQEEEEDYFRACIMLGSKRDGTKLDGPSCASKLETKVDRQTCV